MDPILKFTIGSFLNPIPHTLFTQDSEGFKGLCHLFLCNYRVY